MTKILRTVLALAIGCAWLLIGFLVLTGIQLDPPPPDTRIIDFVVTFACTTVVCFFMLLFCFHTEKVERYLKKIAGE